MPYIGGKNGNGSFQHIISEIPHSRFFVEGFAGSAAVWRNMRPCARSVLIDADPRAVELLLSEIEQDDCVAGVQVLQGSFLEWLKDIRPELESYASGATLYLDPPYPFSVRRSGREGLYRYEFGEEWQHSNLLCAIRRLPCNVLISSYENPLYNAWLTGWRKKTWQVRTRRGNATECLYMNFEVPVVLQDARYIGGNFTQRQRLRRLAGVERR